jgi:hypothetical protein
MRRFFAGKIGVRKTQVPTLVGLKQSAAISLLSSRLLNYTSTHVNVGQSSQDKDVLSQDISAGTVLPVGTVVPFVYKIYTGVTVPNLSGQSRSSAQSMIASAGLVYSGESSTSSGATSENNGTVSSQSPSAGSLVDPGSSVSYSYYSYVAPPVTTGTLYVTYIFQGVVYNESYIIDENNIVAQDISQAVSAYTLLLTGIGATSINASTSGPPPSAVLPTFGFTPAPPFGFTPAPPFGFTPAPPFGFTPAPPFGFTPAPPTEPFQKGYKSVSANTLIKSKNPEGLTPAISLTVGDVLYSADITDLDSGSTLNSFQYGWSSSNISVNTDKETTVMGLTAYFVDEVYVINGSKFSDTHFILIKRQENGLDTIKFERVTDILSTDMLWSQAELNWVPINSLQVLAQRELVVCINVEPYDVFFIEGDILVHDSQPLEHIKQYAVSAPGEDLTEALMALYDSVVNEERYIQEATDAVALLEQTQSPNDLQSAWTAVLLLNSDPFELVENEDSIKAGLIARIRAVEDNIIK